MLFPGARAFKVVPGNGYQTYPAKNAASATMTLANWVGAGTWVEVAAATTEAIYAVGLWWSISGSATTAREWEVDIGVGAAASEVAVATVSGAYTTSEPQGEYGTNLPFPVPVASGVRVSLRVRQNSGTTGRVPQNMRMMYVVQSEVVPV